MNKCEKQLYVEIVVQKVLGLFCTYKAVFAGTFLFGLLAHGFAFTNKLINFDDVHFMFSLGATIRSGRWALNTLEHILPLYSMPWFNGILTIFLIGIAVCFMVDIFSIRRPLSRFVLAALVISFPSLTATFTFMYTSTAYAISFLLAVISAWLILNEERGYFSVAVLTMAFSIGIYQAYISVTASILVLLVLQKILEQEEMKSIWISGVRYVLFLVISLAAYYMVTILIQKLSGIPMGSYAANRINHDLLKNLIHNLALAFTQYIRFFVYGEHGLFFQGFSSLLHCLMLILTLILLVLWCQQVKHWTYAGMLVVILLLYPVSVNCIYLLVPSLGIHTLVLYGVVTIYLLFFIVLEFSLKSFLAITGRREAIKKIISEVLITGMLVIACFNMYVGNQAYLKLHIKYENNYAFYTTLIAQIQSRDDFDEQSKIALIGNFQYPEFYSENFAEANRIWGFDGVYPKQYSRQEFVLHYLGLDIPFASSAEIKEIAETQEFQQMANYPYSGCITKIGSYIVVKFSDYPIDS